MKAASLNHVYRLIWSHVQNAWTVVSEIAGSKGKKSLSAKVASTITYNIFNGNLSQSAKMAIKIGLGIAAFSAGQYAYALPSNAVVDIGHAEFVTSNNNTTLDINQTTSTLKASYNSFNIGANETVNLNQQAGFKAMFIVTGNDASQIQGKFNVSNMLLFVNPNGVYFASGSEVNVGSVIFSTLKISDDDFLAGNYKFTGTNNMGSIVNHGVIKAKDEGYIVLLGKTVDNSGTLVASNGSVVLGSAKEATLDFFGNGLVKAKLSGDALEATIKNSGKISADGGFVQMATNARSAAINISGIVEANQLVERDGVIRLEGGDNAKVQVTGQLIAKGQNTTGGTIEVTGEQVALLNGAVLDASGDTGGGKVLVGGDYQGKNDAVYNARTTYIAQGATIKADALQQGNGGKVIVWADDLTRYYGSISAQGGAVSGNGGLVEVSGKANLDFHGKVNVAADNGLGGTLLLDPTNIVLSNSPSTLIPITDVATEDVAFANNAGGATTTINVNDVSGFSQLWLQATNDITIDNALIMTNPVGSIKLEANNDINVKADIKSGFLGYVNLKANADSLGGGDILISANITGGSQGVTLSAVNITQTAGNINTNQYIGGHVKMDATGDINLGSANINTSGTNFGPTAGVDGGDVEITSKSLTMTGNINTVGAASAQAIAQGGQGGKVTITTTDNISIGKITTSAGDAGVNSVDSRLSGDVKLTSNSGDINTGDINASGGFNNLGGKVTLNAAGAIKTGDINTSAGDGRIDTDGKGAGDVNVVAGTNLTVGAVTAKGANGVDGKGINKAGGVAGAVTLQAKAGNIDMGAIDNTGGKPTGTGAAGLPAKILVQAGQDIITNGDITNNHKGADAVQLVAGGKFDNTKDINISTDGKWTVYSNDPTNDIKGAKLLAAYAYKQYGTAFGGALLGTGNGFVHKVTPNVTATLTGTSTKVVDGNNTVTDLSGLSVVTSGVLDNDVVVFSPATSPVTSASFDTAAVGAGKVITTGAYSIASFRTNENKPIFNAYTTMTNNSTATGSITAVPVTPTAFISPRDNAGLGGLIPNNPVLNTMLIVSLNPAAGDEDDLDAVACPTPEDHLGATPILSSGVKLPDGVNSNCI